MSHQQKNSDNFFKEIAIVQAITPTMDTDIINHNASGIAQKSRSFSPKVSVGDIRLLPQPERITYVAVVQKLNDDSFLVVPYSRFSAPANDQEMISENQEGLFLRVLQIWNALTVTREILTRTWNVGETSHIEQKRIINFLSALRFGTSVPEEIQKLTALPLEHATSFHKEYFSLEKNNLQAFIAENRQIEDKLFKRELFNAMTYNPVFEQQELSLAAGDESKNPYSELYVEGFNVLITLEYGQTEKSLYLKVYDPDDKLSNAFDAWSLADSKGNKLALIKNGYALIKNFNHLEGHCCLLDTAGVPHAFKKASDL